MMNRNQLKYFIAAAESRSFTKAAEQFYISQTAITQQMQLLEESLGCTLFDRSTRPVSLTPAGKIFLGEARAILDSTNLKAQADVEQRRRARPRCVLRTYRNAARGLCPRLRAQRSFGAHALVSSAKPKRAYKLLPLLDRCSGSRAYAAGV